MPNETANKLRGMFPQLYAGKSDAEVLEDFRVRGQTLAGGPFDPERWKQGVTQKTGFQFEETPSELWTGGKALVNSLGMGLPGWVYGKATGEELFSDAELEENKWGKLAGDVVGSVAGLGKLSLLGKGGKIAGKALAAAIGKNAAKGAAVGEVAGRMVHGGMLGVGQETERQQIEQATNRTGQLEGNPALAKAIAGVTNAPLSVPFRSLRTAGLIADPSRAVKLAEAWGGPVAGFAGSAAAAAVSDTDSAGEGFDKFRAMMTDPGALAMMGAFGYLGHRDAKVPWAAGANATPSPAASQAAPNQAPPAASAGPRPGQVGPMDEAALQAMMERQSSRYSELQPTLDARVQLERLRDIQRQAESKPWLAGRHKDVFGRAMIDQGDGRLAEADLLNPTPDARGRYLVDVGGTPLLLPADKIKDVLFALRRGDNVPPLTGRFDQLQGFSAMRPEDVTVQDPNGGAAQLIASIFGHRKGSTGNIDLAVMRPDGRAELLSRPEDFGPEYQPLLGKWGEITQRILSKQRPLDAIDDAPRTLTASPEEVDLQMQLTPDVLGEALRKARSIRDRQRSGRPSQGSNPGKGPSDDEFQIMLQQLEEMQRKPGGGS